MAKNDAVDTTAALEAAAEDIILQGIPEASAVARPSNIGDTWVEREYEELEAEQKPLWTAAGFEESRSADSEAGSLQLEAESAQRMLDGHSAILQAAEDRFHDTVEALAPFRRRPAGSKVWHYATKAGLLIGDTAGISTAAIWLGEIPAIAVVMAASAAIATVVAGLTGTEVRDLRAAVRRERDLDSLTEKQLPFRHLFSGADSGKRYVRALLGVSASVGVIIAGSVFALRSSIESPLVGIVYGGIAGAIAAASFIESYMHADEVADLLDHAEHDYEKELKRHGLLAASAPWAEHTRQFASAESIVNEHAKRGEAAQLHVRALKFGILRRNPSVMGHGEEGESVGRRTRRADV